MTACYCIGVGVRVCAHRYGADAHGRAGAQRVSESLEEIELALGGTGRAGRVDDAGSVQGAAGARAMYRLGLARRAAARADARRGRAGRLRAILAGGRGFRCRAAAACRQIINECS